MITDLTEFGFNVQKSNTLRCRICDTILIRYYVCVLLGTVVKYGYCRKTSHGISVTKATMQESSNISLSHPFDNEASFQSQIHLYEQSDKER